jgi:D-alanyl-D-alanine carboxypeptidase (penicillin-binding protein 5/6)
VRLRQPARRPPARRPPADSPRRATGRAALAALAGLAALATAIVAAPAAIAGPALAAPALPPAAPAPTSTEVSPGAPDPNPPLGGIGPDGQPIGGQALLSRGVLIPPGGPPLPADIPAASFVLADLDSGQVLAARDPHGRYQPASILKILTSLVLLPQLPGSQQVVVTHDAAAAEGSAVGLVEGGTYTVDQLFAGLMLMSGNDAAMALADAIGGPDATVAQMNALAQQLGAYDTYVQTPSGLDGWQQLTSAYDMTLVLRQAVDDPRLLAYDNQRTGELPPQDVAGKQWGPVPLANQAAEFLDTVPGALLAKSGYTDAALSTYMAAATRNGHRYGVVLMRTERAPLDHWQQAAALFDWAAALPPGTPPVGVLIDHGASAAGSTRASTAPSGPRDSTSSGSQDSPSSAPAGTTSPPGVERGGAAASASPTKAGVHPVSAAGSAGQSRARGWLAALGAALAAAILGGGAAALARRRMRSRGGSGQPAGRP